MHSIRLIPAGSALAKAQSIIDSCILAARPMTVVLSGQYSWAGSLVIANASDISVEGVSCSIVQSSPVPCLLVSNSTNIRIANLSVSGGTYAVTSTGGSGSVENITGTVSLASGWINKNTMSVIPAAAAPSAPVAGAFTSYAAQLLGSNVAPHFLTSMNNTIRLYTQINAADPVGGEVADVEARVAISAILMTLRSAGLLGQYIWSNVSIPDVAAEYYSNDEYPHMMAGLADLLCETQLWSGAWRNPIGNTESFKNAFAFRLNGPAGSKFNRGTLDNGLAYTAMQVLVAEYNRAGGGGVDDAIQYLLTSLLGAQRPNGGWPQQWSSPCVAEEWPDIPASYAESWPQTWPVTSIDPNGADVLYAPFYTINDKASENAARMMLLGHQQYGDPDYLASAIATGQFLLKAQMPSPQMGWAQQYNANMNPAWARRYEPPAVASRETQEVCEFLLYLYESHDQDPDYLTAVENAIAWLKSSLRTDGKLARFYELQTNTPLYFTKDYALTYSSASMPTHYEFVVTSRIAAIESSLEALQESA